MTLMLEQQGQKLHSEALLEDVKTLQGLEQKSEGIESRIMGQTAKNAEGRNLDALHGKEMQEIILPLLQVHLF